MGVIRSRWLWSFSLLVIALTLVQLARYRRDQQHREASYASILLGSTRTEVESYLLAKNIRFNNDTQTVGAMTNIG